MNAHKTAVCIITTKAPGPHLVLDPIVIHGHSAVFQELRERLPVVQAVIDRLGNRAAVGHSSAFKSQPSVQFFPQWLAAFLAHLQSLLATQPPGIGFNAVQPCNSPDGLSRHRAGVGFEQFVKLPPRVSQTICSLAPLKGHGGIVASVRINNQGPCPAFEELVRVLTSTPLAEVVHHTGHIFECSPGVGPHVSLLGLAASRVKQADGRLISVQHARAQYESPVCIVQRQQLRSGLAAPGRQARARRVHSRARVDLLLPVVRHVVTEAADHGVRLQARRWDSIVKDLGGCWLLDHHLTAPAGPFAPNLTLHEELRRNDVQTFADVLAHAHHGLAALWGWTVCILRLDSGIHSRQVWRQCFAFGLAAWLLVWCSPVLGRSTGLQGGQLRLQASLVSGQCLFEEGALLGTHALGLGAKLPSLQARQLESDALNLGVAPLDGLGISVDAFGLFSNVLTLLVDLGQ